MILGEDDTFLQYGEVFAEAEDGGRMVIYYDLPFPVETKVVTVTGDALLIWFPDHTNRFSFEVRRIDGADIPTHFNYAAIGR
jgi:hypothetical protein